MALLSEKEGNDLVKVFKSDNEKIVLQKGTFQRSEIYNYIFRLKFHFYLQLFFSSAYLVHVELNKNIATWRSFVILPEH